MYKLIFFLMMLIPAINNCGGTPPMQPAASTSRVTFVKEIATAAPVAVGVDQDGWIYVARQDGTVGVMTGEGAPVVTLKGVDPDGRKILEQPAGLAVYDKKIFVVDRALCRVVVFSCSGSYVDSFGSKGSGDKEFRRPSGIHVYDGVIYVADSGGDRIQVFSADGVFLQSITGSPAGPDASETIREPLGVAVDYRGFVWVTCDDPMGTKTFLSNGTFYKQLSDSGRHGAIAVGRDGLYVADQERLNIRKYDYQGNLLFSFGSKGAGRARFASISGLAVDPTGRVYVADQRQGRIHVFMPEQGEAYADWQKMPPPTSVKWIQDIPVLMEETVWTGPDTFWGVDRENNRILKITDGQIRENICIPDCRVTSLAVDREDRVWVLDGSERRVIRLGDDHRVQFSFGSAGREAGQFARPAALAVSSAGIVYVSDTKNRCVQAFSHDGVLLNVFRTGKGGMPFVAPAALSLDQNDVLHVLDRDRCTVTAISPEGRILFEFGRKGRGRGEFIRPVSLFATTAEIYVLDAESCSIKVFHADGGFVREFGTQGRGKGDFREPTCISPISNTVFCVADPGNRRVQVLASVHSPLPPVDTVAEEQMHAVRISWRKRPEPYVSSYRVYRAERADGPFVSLGSSRTHVFMDDQVASEKTYYYRVAARAEDGREGGKGRLVKAEPAKYVPSMPSGLTAVPHDWSVDLRWEQNLEDFVTGYTIYREIDEEMTVVGQTEATVFSENCLSPDTPYTYRVAAVSSDGKEGPGAAITTTTAVSNRPPLEIDILEMKDIFSNTYKIYENEGMGRIRLTNNTCEPISGIKLSFSIKEFMDFPSEEAIDELPAGAGMEIVLRAVFNNQILKVTEDMPVQTEIKASYYENKEPNTFNRNHTVNIYEKHRMMWDEKRRFATFITPKDPLLLEFARSVVTQYGDAWDNIQRAAVLFDALGVMGVTYMRDPSNPYQITSGETDFVDYIQYPRETLQRRSGDCDDLVALYASALESIGIKTLVVDNPGHILLMFSAGIPDDQSGYTMDGMFVRHNDALWVPVETTLVGRSFIRAWEAGSKNHHGLKDQDLSLLDIRHAWHLFKPASLPPTDWRPGHISRKAIETRFHDEFTTLRNIGIKFRGRRYLEVLENNPQDTNALLQIGIINARAGEIDVALKTFEKVLAVDAHHAGALNNMANVYFLKERYVEAMAAYKEAVALAPQDPLIWVNLARCCQRLDMVPQAKDAFQKACALDPEVGKTYRAMSLALLNTL